MTWRSQEMRDLDNYGFAEIEGVKFKATQRELRTGDMYVAERNTGIQLLTVAWHDLDKRLVIAKENFGERVYDDTYECIGVEFVED